MEQTGLPPFICSGGNIFDGAHIDLAVHT